MKLGDEMTAAAEPLSDAAFRLHVEALAWSARNLLDLVIPFRHLGRFAYCAEPELAAKELVEAGWWEEAGDAWNVGLRWPEWQMEKTEVERRRARDMARQRRHRKHLADDHADCLPVSCPQAPVSCPQAPGVESTMSRRDSRRESRGTVPNRTDPKGRVRGGAETRLSRRDKPRPTKPPTRADAVGEVDGLSAPGRAGLRDRAIAALGDALPDGWERDEGHPWEPTIYGRMTRLMLDLLEHEYDAHVRAGRRTGT